MKQSKNIKKSVSSTEYQKVVTEHTGHNITEVRYQTQHTSVTSSVKVQTSSKPRSFSVAGYPASDLSRTNVFNTHKSIFDDVQNKDAVPRLRTSSTSEPYYRTALNPNNTFGTYTPSISQPTKTNSSLSPRTLASVSSPTRTYAGLSSTRPSIVPFRKTSLSLSPTQSTILKTESIPTYSIKGSKLRGKALIINNIKFQNDQERSGAKKDGQDLVNTLNKIGFSCTSHNDLSAESMKKKIAIFSKGLATSIDVSLIVIMSHGTNVSSADGRALRGGYTEIVGTDYKRISIDDVIDIFNEYANEIEGKPKIFIFQCCRGDSDQIHVDAVPLKKTRHSDMLLAFSTLPGFVSNRDPSNGTWYIQSICEVFSKRYKDHHVEDMLKIVNELLSKKDSQYSQTSTYESRGFKKCYLYPQK